MTEEWQGHRCNAISGDGVISQVWRVGEGFKEKRYSTCSLRDVTLTVRRGLRCWEPGYRMNDYGWAWGSWPRGGEVEHTGTGCSVIGQRWAPEGDWNEPGFCDKGGDNQFLPRAQPCFTNVYLEVSCDLDKKGGKPDEREMREEITVLSECQLTEGERPVSGAHTCNM